MPLMKTPTNQYMNIKNEGFVIYEEIQKYFRIIHNGIKVCLKFLPCFNFDMFET